MKLTNEENAKLHTIELELALMRTEMIQQGYPLWGQLHGQNAFHYTNQEWNKLIRFMADVLANEYRDAFIEIHTVPQ